MPKTQANSKSEKGEKLIRNVYTPVNNTPTGRQVLTRKTNRTFA